MTRLILLLSLLLPVSTAAAQVTLFPGQSGAALRAAIRAEYTPVRTLGYGPARDVLYQYEQDTYGQVCGVYTQYCIRLTPGADPSADADRQSINAEHTWPQSRGAEPEPQRSDMHILFPARANVNSARGNFPYSEIPDADADAWYRMTDSQSTVPTVMVDEWSERDNAYPGTSYTARFEPREDAKGNVARAVAYFAAVYEAAVEGYNNRGFLTTMLADLRSWNTLDGVSARERDKSSFVATRQGSTTGGGGRGENPFVLDPTLLDRAFGDYGGSTTPPPPGPGGNPGDYNPSVVWINELHYDNLSTDTGEFVELAGIAGTSLAGYRIVLYNGSSSAVYNERTLNGVIVDEGMGYGAVSFAYPSNGIQNGAPDGIALVDDGGELVQFVSYEGTMTGAGGPADGVLSADIGVAETNATPAGQSLQLSGAGSRYGDFAWSAPSAETPGTLNAGQSFRPVASEPGGERAGTLTLRLAGPNPVRGVTAVAVSVPAATADARVDVFDALGRRVAALYSGPLAAGERQFVVDASALAPGVYVVRSLVGAEVSSLRVVVRR